MEETILLVTAGQGPLECCLVVYRVKEMLTIEAHKLGLTVEVFDSVQAEKPGTLNSCKLKFKGNIPDAFISEWQGTVQWIPRARTGQRISGKTGLSA